MKTIISFFILFLNIIIVNGQKTLKTIISGDIYGGGTDTLQLRLNFNDPWRAGGSFKPQIVKNGHFYFELPTNTEPGDFIELVLQSNIFEQVIMRTMIEAGDRIHVKIIKKEDGSKISFDGKNAQKYRCQQSIDSLIRTSFSSLQYSEMMDEMQSHKLIQFYNEFQSTLIAIIDRSKNQINPRIRMLMLLDAEGIAKTGCLVYYTRAYKASKNDTKKSIDALFRQTIFSNADTVLGAIKSSAFGYRYFLISLSEAKAQFSKTDSEFHELDLYTQIKSEYSGLLLDRTILLALNQFYGTGLLDYILNQDQLDSVWADAATVLTQPSLKLYAAKHLYYKRKGVPLIELNLPDERNHNVTIDQFKGKVVLIDIYFTGCKWCLAYNKRLDSSVYPIFSHNANVVFLSVSGDIYKDQWLKTIKEGKYTRKDNINVYTRGLGFTDSFMKYYEFSGGPYSLLLDKNGKIFEKNPPINNMPKLIQLINQALL